ISNLLEFRKQVLGLASGSGSVDAVRASLKQLGAYPDLARALESALLPSAKAAPAATSAPKAAPPPTGGVFDLVDAESSPAPETVSPEQVERTTAKLIDAVLGVSGSGSKPAPAALRAVAAQAEAAVAPMLRAVLHDGRFRELEGSWWGLRFLVRSVDFRAVCRV